MNARLSKYSNKIVVITTDDGRSIEVYVDGRNISVRTHAGDFNHEKMTFDYFAYPED